LQTTMSKTTIFTWGDLKNWVMSRYGVHIDDCWLDVLLQEHDTALRRHIERKKTKMNATMKELIDVMIDEIEEAMQRHQLESN